MTVRQEGRAVKRVYQRGLLKEALRQILLALLHQVVAADGVPGNG